MRFERIAVDPAAVTGKPRRQAELRRSLQNPHPESGSLAEQGFEEWSRSLPDEDSEALVDSSAGRPVRWVPGEGWVERRD